MNHQSKLLLLVLGAGLCAAPLLRAQDAPKPAADTSREERREKVREHMKERREHAAEELGLTADQQARMKGIDQQEKAALDAIRSDTALSKEQKRAKAQETHKSFADQRRALLTPEQQKKADEMREKMKERREERREQRREHGKDGK